MCNNSTLENWKVVFLKKETEKKFGKNISTPLSIRNTTINILFWGKTKRQVKKIFKLFLRENYNFIIHKIKNKK